MSRLLFLFAFGFVQLVANGQSNSDSLKVFFVGNSYTYFNNLPELVEGISESLDGPVVTSGVHTHPGINLRTHLDDGHLQKLFSSSNNESADWDVVVLQDNSWLGTHDANPETGKLSDPEVFHDAVRELHTMLGSFGASGMLYMTWAKYDFPDQTPKLASAYNEIGSELGLGVAPVGLAWATVREERPDIDLFIPDGSHPSALGSYLTASVLYAQITGMSPVGASNYIDGNAWHYGEIVDTVVDTTLAFIPEKDAEYLQRVAWRSVNDLKNSGR